MTLSVFSSTPEAEEAEEEAEPAPPPIASRPEKTKSIYTKPIDEDEDMEPHASLKVGRNVDCLLVNWMVSWSVH